METFVGPAVRPARRLGTLALLGALSSFGPLSMDMYLPSTPTIAANLHASQLLVQLTLSGCLAGLAVGQLVAGPLSDGLGRKRPLLAALVAFTLLSVACAAAPDIGALIVFRFLQGMAGAGGVVLSLAIVRDQYSGTELARVLGSLMLVFGLAPVLAPVIGGQILRFTSWRGVFGVLAAIGLVLFLLAWTLPETLPPERRNRARLRRLPADSRALLRDRQYVGYTLAIALGNAALITYISALPFIVEDAYHKSPQLFSVFFMINSIGLVTMAQLGARLVKRVPVSRVVLASLLVMAAGCATFLAVALTGHPPLAALLVPLFFFIAFFGSMRPNATAIALANQGAIAGTASAWVGALPFLLGAFLSPLAGLGGEGAATVAGILLTALCAGALPCVLLIARPRSQVAGSLLGFTGHASNRNRNTALGLDFRNVGYPRVYLDRLRQFAGHRTAGRGQGPDRHGRAADHGRLPAAGRQRAARRARRRLPRRAARGHRGRTGPVRGKDEPARARLRDQRDQHRLRHPGQPARPAPDARRLVQRLRDRGRRG